MRNAERDFATFGVRNKSCLFQESFVVLHHYLRFELLIEFECDGNDDEESGCGERIAYSEVVTRIRAVERIEDERRNQCEQGKEDCSEQRDAVGNLLQEIAGGFTRTNAGDKSAVLLDILRHVFGVELNLCIEVCKEQNEDNHEHVVRPSTRTHMLCIPCVRAAFGPEQCHNHLREHEKGRCEDDGHNAASVDSDRNVGGLTAVHLVTLDLFAVLNRDSSFRHVHKHYEREEEHDDDDESEDIPNVSPFFADHLERACHRGACGCENTDENDEGRTVAHAVFGDSFAEPHDHRAARHQNDDDACHCEVGIFPTCLEGEHGRDFGFPTDHDTDSLNGCEHECEVAGDLGEFFTTLVTLFGHLLKRGNNEREKLHNDECVDERKYAEREQRCVCKGTAGDHG